MLEGMEDIDGHIAVDSTFEAEMVERVTPFLPGQERPIVRHRIGLAPTHDEVLFLDRTLQYGRLVLSYATSEQFEMSLAAMIAEDKPFNGITVEQAELALNAIHRSRLSHAEQDMPAAPDERSEMNGPMIHEFPRPTPADVAADHGSGHSAAA